MTFHPAAATVKLVVGGQADGQNILNILHYKYSGVAPTPAAMTSFLAAWLIAFQTEWLAAHANNYTIQTLTATDIATPSGATATTTVVGPGNVGTFSNSALLPNNAAIAVSLRTGLSGRRNRGRVFLGGLGNAQINLESVTSNMQLAINTLFTHLIALTVSSIYDLAVTSLLNATSQIVTGYALNTVADSMRRRLPTRGS